MLQDIFNFLPNLNVDELVRSFAVKTNDTMVVIYLSSLIRSIIALHNLINNKLTNRDAERKAESKDDEAAKTKTGNSKDAGQDKLTNADKKGKGADDGDNTPSKGKR